MTVGKQQGELGRLRVLGGPDSGVVFVLTAERVTIGRGDENNVILSDLKTSRKHAEISIGAAGAAIRDVGSAHGVMVNGVAQRQAPLRNGDKVGLGETVLEFFGSETGATRMIAAPPEKVAPSVGTGMSGLTRFITRPEAARKAGAQRTSPPSVFEKNKKLVAIVGVLMALAAMVPEVEKKQNAKKRGYVDPLEVEAARAPGSLGPAPVSPDTLKAAEAHFKECFREYRVHNYLRAQVACETALQIYGDHALARIYLESTKKNMENEAKEYFKAAKQDEDASRWRSALNRYNAVKRLYAKDQSNPNFKEAEIRTIDLGKKIKDGER